MDVVDKEKSSLSVLNYNVRGLLPLLGDEDFLEYVQVHDFVVFTETHLSFDFDHNVKFDDYSCMQKCGIKTSMGGRRADGVMLLIKKSLSPYIKEIENPFMNLITCEVDKKLYGTENPVMIIAVYNNPSESPV